MLKKKTILLSATAGEDFEDILMGLFGVKKESYVEFDHIIRQV